MIKKKTYFGWSKQGHTHIYSRLYSMNNANTDRNIKKERQKTKYKMILLSTKF